MCLLLTARTFHPSLDAIFLDMIRDLPSLNFLTASRNAFHHRVLAIGHVILQRDRVTQSCHTTSNYISIRIITHGF